MNRQEINLRIARLLGLDVSDVPSHNYPDTVHGYDALGLDFIVDYCNNPSDLMPLVWEHGISFEKVHFGEDTPYFVTRYFDAMVSNKDPQLALALCLLEALEEKKPNEK